MNLKERLEIADAEATRTLELMKDPSLSLEKFVHHTRSYVMSKFFLEPGEYASDDIFELAEASIEKLLRSNDKSVTLAVGSTTCTNQSSTDIKKVLLSLTLQRALGVSMTPEESAAAETVPQLAGTLYDLLETKRGR